MPSAAPLARVAGRHGQLAHGDHEVEVVDRLRHQPHQPAAEEHAGAEAGGGAERGPPPAPRRAPGRRSAPRVTPSARRVPIERPALDDREGHGVVDEEDAADQRQQRERGQVEPEGARHLLGGPRARRAAGRIWAPGGRTAAARASSRRPVGALRHDQVDPVEPAPRGRGAPGRRRCPSPGDRRAPGGCSRPRAPACPASSTVRSTPPARTRKVSPSRSPSSRAVAAASTPAPGRVSRGPRSTASPPPAIRPPSAAEVGAERRLREGIDAQQVERPAPALPGAAGTVTQPSTTGAAALDPGLQRPAGGRRRRAAPGAADHLVRGPAGDRLGREGEGAAGAGVGEVDRDHHRHAQRHARAPRGRTARDGGGDSAGSTARAGSSLRPPPAGSPRRGTRGRRAPPPRGCG